MIGYLSQYHNGKCRNYSIYRAPVPLSPSTIPIPKMCPAVPIAKTSTAVNPAGSADIMPDLLSESLRAALALRLAVGANPKRAAPRVRAMDTTMICVRERESDGREVRLGIGWVYKWDWIKGFL